jgi:diguanylate cyclase (GGDEF)-like protein/PAS domain S-box-containing protein
MDEFVTYVELDDRESVWQSVAGQTEFTSEYHVTVDGELRTLVNRGAWYPGPEGHPGYLVGTSHDVTEERAARAAERRAEAQFRRAFEDTLTAMAICDVDLRFVQVNDALCELGGIPREQLIGRDSRVFAEPRDGYEPELTADASHIHVEERRYEHPDGRVLWIEVAISAVEVPGEGVVEYFMQVRDITERLQHEEQLRYLAEHDPLTGVLNRRAFDTALQKHLSRTEVQPKRGALLMIDLDNFKHHNDTYGHASGDELLKGITQAVQGSLREHDLVGRLGGDEFVVLLSETTHSEAELVAGRLLAEIRAYASLAVPDDDMPVTASIGIVDFLPGGLAGWALVKDADQALYEAKESGRDRWVHYTI